MPEPTFKVPKGTKLEIVYSNRNTRAFTVDFQPESKKSPPQRLVSETVESDSGDVIPFLLITENGTVKMATEGMIINEAVPLARITLCASPYFIARFVVSGAGDQMTEAKILVTEETP